MSEQLAQIIADKLTDYAAKNWMDWAEEEGIFIGHWDKLSVLDSIIQKMHEEKELESVDINWFVIMLDNPIVKAALNEMDSIATAAAKEQREWDQAQQSPEAMLRYYGMNRGMFL